MSKGLTLLHYWEELTPKQLRLIHDLLKGNSSKRCNLSMGLLPFVPVREIKLVLMREPMSPWTQYLFELECNDRLFEWVIPSSDSRYRRSLETDRKDYATILEVITKEPERPTKLGTLLEQWREKHGEGQP